MYALSNLHKLVLNRTLGTLAIRALAAVAVLGMNIVLARLLPIGDYGVIALGLSWITIAATVACFGLDTVSMRYVAQYRISEAGARLIPGYLRWSTRFVLALGIAAAVVSWALFPWIYASLEHEQFAALCVIAAATPLLALSLARAGVLRGQKRPVLAAIVAMLLRPLIVLSAVCVLFLWLGGGDGGVAVAVSILFAQAGIALFAVYATRSRDVGAPAEAQAGREWFRVARPLAFMNVMTVLISNLDMVLVGHFVDSAAAGIYRASVQVANLVSFGLMASNGIVAPLIAELYAQDRRDQLQKMLQFSVLFVSAIGVGGAIFLAFAGPIALGLFGGKYLAGYGALLVLLGAQAVNALCGPTGNVMAMTGYQSQAARIFAVSASISVVLNLLLIPRIGLLGAAIANAVGLVSWNLAILLFLKRKVGIDPSILGVFRRREAV